MNGYSIRRRLVIAILGAMIAILGGIGLASHLVTQHESEEIFSARLATTARVLEALAARQLETASISQPIIITLPGELENSSSGNQEAYGHDYESKIAFQVWHDDGILLARSASAPDKAFGPFAAGFHQRTIGDEVWQVFALHSGRVWIFAAENDEVRNEMSRDIGISILTPLIVGALLLIIVVNLLALHSLRPLQALAQSIARRDSASLSPILIPQTPQELKPVIDELNKLLKKVHEAFRREQRFIDAAAHEIRTPIAALQLHVQNAINANRKEDRIDSLDEAAKAVRRTTKLAEQLLAFSRISGQVDDERKTLVALDVLCRDAIAVQEGLLAQRGQRIRLIAHGDFVIEAEQGKIERLLQNLIENASQYGSAPGEIEIELKRQGEWIELSIANDGPAIPDEEKEKVFLPYYRIPGSHASGSGLGLAIVQEVVNQHHGSIRIENKTADSGTRIVASFKAAG